MVITCTFHFCLTQDVLNELLVPNIKYICKHVFLGFFLRKTCVLKVVIRYKKTTILVHLPAYDNLSSQGTVRQIAQWNSNLLLAV